MTMRSAANAVPITANDATNRKSISSQYLQSAITAAIPPSIHPIGVVMIVIPSVTNAAPAAANAAMRGPKMNEPSATSPTLKRAFVCKAWSDENAWCLSHNGLCSNQSMDAFISAICVHTAQNIGECCIFIITFLYAHDNNNGTHLLENKIKGIWGVGCLDACLFYPV